MLANSALRVLFLALLPVAMAQIAVGGTAASLACQTDPNSAGCQLSLGASGAGSVGASQRSRSRRDGGVATASAYCKANPTSAECSIQVGGSAAGAVGASQRSRMRRASAVVKRGATANCTGTPGTPGFSCEASVDVGAAAAITGASARARAKRDTKQLEFSSCPTGFKACAIGNAKSDSYECIGNWEECTA